MAGLLGGPKGMLPRPSPSSKIMGGGEVAPSPTPLFLRLCILYDILDFFAKIN